MARLEAVEALKTCYTERGQFVSKQHVCSKVEGYLFTQNDTLNYFKLNFLEELENCKFLV